MKPWNFPKNSSKSQFHLKGPKILKVPQDGLFQRCQFKRPMTFLKSDINTLFYEMEWMTCALRPPPGDSFQCKQDPFILEPPTFHKYMIFVSTWSCTFHICTCLFLQHNDYAQHNRYMGQFHYVWFFFLSSIFCLRKSTIREIMAVPSENGSKKRELGGLEFWLFVWLYHTINSSPVSAWADGLIWYHHSPLGTIPRRE